MAILHLKVGNQTLTASCDIDKIVEDSIKYLQYDLETSEDWSGMTPEVIFTYDGEDITSLDNFVPSYVLRAPGFKVSVNGYIEANGLLVKRITTSPINIGVYPAGALEGTVVSEEELKDDWLSSVQAAANTAKINSETAMNTANEANTNATNAANTSNEAKIIANTAENNATNALSNSSQALGIIQENDKTVDNLSQHAGDTIVKKVSGQYVQLDDISPIHHKIKIQAKPSKNLYSLKAILENGDYSAIAEVYIDTPITLSLKKTEDFEVSSQVWRFRFQYLDGTYKYWSDSASTLIANFPATKENPIVKITAREINITVGSYYDIQIEKGNFFTGYEPYSPISNLPIKISGKNIIPFTNNTYNYGKGKSEYKAGNTYVISGISYTINEDGSIHAVGTATAGAVLQIFINDILKIGNHTLALSGTESNYLSHQIRLVRQNASGDNGFRDFGTGVLAYGIDLSGAILQVVVYGGRTVDCVFHPMLELGEQFSDYTIPGDVYTVLTDENGYCEIDSNLGTCFYSEAGYNVLECEYHQQNNDIASNISNTFIEEVYGENVVLSDISPLTHNIKAQVRGKNLFQPSCVTGLDNIKYTIDENIITIPTGQSTYGLQFSNIDLKLEKGKTYTFSCKYEGEHGTSWGWRPLYRNGTILNTSNSEIFTFTLTEELSTINFYTGSPLNITEEIKISEIQIELNEQQTPYEPYYEPNKISIKYCEKNLFEADKLLNATGWSFDRGYYSGLPNDLHNIFRPDGGKPIVSTFKENTQYTLSVVAKTASAKVGPHFIFKYTDGTTDSLQIKTTTYFKFVLTSDANKTIEGLYLSYGNNIQTFLREIQLEEGTTATAYEDYHQKIIIPNEKGEFYFQPKSSVVHLTPDRAGATIKCSYNKDLNKVISQLVNAIVALGGNI